MEILSITNQEKPKLPQQVVSSSLNWLMMCSRRARYLERNALDPKAAVAPLSPQE